MSQNTITLVGNVVDSPTRRRAGAGEVTKFRLAATERRLDGGSGEWVDGDTFYVDVDAWNGLGGSVSACVVKGDPVVVVGRITTSEYEVDGGRRSRPVVRAQVVGHDLSRGSAVFKRTARAAGSTDAVGEGTSDVVTEAGEPIDVATGEVQSQPAPF
ncbi:single-stranded DNA-binding protein [Modestobacter sp. Leaf380]|uniref:single-stranded DNA-binding protein n=1 Tax=Modestobacter sp. Leaf380 TaxID=1736356 RepID=UPI0006FFA894|nr:single-stranded DNA-binding protein [Modestobacter sp. Leaf380]KQS66132.1 hypothetical protein ASG41_12310 [Modestobacter sp. Leaf380]